MSAMAASVQTRAEAAASCHKTSEAVCCTLLPSLLLSRPPPPMTQYSTIETLKDYVGAQVTVRGWVTHVRSSGKVAFIVVRDGTGIAQAVVVKSVVSADVWDTFARLTHETSIAVTGDVRAEPRAPGGHELSVSDLGVLGSSPIDYPIQPKEHGIDFLLDHRHFWLRSPRQTAIGRVRHEIEQAIHDFFYERGFVRVDTPILTAAIGERSGLFSTEYSRRELRISRRLASFTARAAAAAFGRIYTFGPTFRAEKSKTRRHLTEFWMIEPEMAFYDTNDNMRLQEDFVSYLVRRCSSVVARSCRFWSAILRRSNASARPFHASSTAMR